VTGLPVKLVDKPWGMDALPAPFAAAPGRRVGEIWFEPPPALPSVMVKYIFTSEKLSVQVHPNDAEARAAGGHTSGKDECWVVIHAEPGATLGIGFDRAIDPAAMRAAALDGSIEQLMTWHPIKPGDFFYIPAGTVHAIGAGVGVIEIQQNADVTYRLYDYGRGRDLHLDVGIAVARGEPYDPALHRHIPDTGTVELADGRYFQAHRVDGVPDAGVRAIYTGPVLVLPRTGTVRIGDTVCHPGECVETMGLDAVEFAGDGQAIVVRAKT
jgi:mannose-6-phosphate isomerase